MSKSILVIDTPECCEKCQLCSFGNYGTKRCTASDRSIFLKDKEHKPVWCPMKETPKKLAEENRWFSKDYAVGFNDCIDEILKERDKNE